MLYARIWASCSSSSTTSSAVAIFSAISSCTPKASSPERSYVSDHRWKPSAARISCAVIRSRSPARRTDPSTTLATPSVSAISGIGRSCPLNAKAEVRAVTSRSGNCASEFRISSVRPSAKYSSSGPLLIATNGRTATDLSISATTAGSDSVASGASCSMNLSTSRNPTAATSTAVVSRLSLRPVSLVIDCVLSTSFSRLTPSGVISNAQANRTATGKPRIRRRSTDLGTQSGAPKASKATSATWASSHAITAYAAATRNTLRRLSSAIRLIPCSGRSLFSFASGQV